MAASAMKLVSVEYEVFGLVQGVFFRKFTKEQARKLGLVGWVRNTYEDTVDGVLQGPQNNVSEMKHWLSTKGSPDSRIDKVEFRKERVIDKLEYQSFSVRH